MASPSGRGPLYRHCQVGSLSRAGREEEGLRPAGGRLHHQDWTLRIARLQEEEEGTFQIKTGKMETRNLNLIRVTNFFFLEAS